MYTVTIQATQDGGLTFLYHPETLVFEVVDRVWQGKWPGVIKPRLEWVSHGIIDLLAPSSIAYQSISARNGIFRGEGEGDLPRSQSKR